MSASSSHKLWRSTKGLDDAGMDLRVAQFNAHTNNRALDSASSSSGLDRQFPLVVAFCAISGAVLFAFLILLWLRQQMSREKNAEQSDRRGLVEEGNIQNTGIVQNSTQHIKDKEKKINKVLVDPEWVPESILSKPQTSKMSCVSTCATIATTTANLTKTPCTPGLIGTCKFSKCENIESKKKLLHRRASTVSLTIEVSPCMDNPIHSVTPTRECMTEEYLLSTGKTLTRAELRKSVNDPGALYREFWDVPSNQPEQVDICGSGIKNRYRTVLPNSRSRVVLPGSDDPVASYINANYVRGYDDSLRYIATQGPLANTVQDFWHMVWTERASVIVMMTRLHEAGKTQCEAYFPSEENSRIHIGPFIIKTLSVEDRGGYSMRDLEVCRDNERRNVQHFWYDSWPDHAVPQTADAMVGLAAEVNSLPGPIVVHCSAGIGRTGGFIALSNGMSQLKREGSVDILSILCQMRYDRGGMIQTAEQYEFVHKALCLFEKTLGD